MNPTESGFPEPFPHSFFSGHPEQEPGTMTTTDLLNCARIARELRTRIIEPIFGPWHFEAESLTTELANAWQSLGRDDRNADSLPPFLLVHIADGEILKWSVELSRPTEIELSEFIESHNLTQAEWGVLLLLRDPDGRRFMPLSVGAFENSGRTTGAIPFREFESTRTIAVRMLERWIQRFEGLLTEAAAVQPATTQKRQRRTKPRMPKEKVEAHWQAIVSSGNRDLIQEYLTLGEIALAKKIGTSRGTLRSVEAFQKRDIALREFNRQNR
jgi:hypothetical protein